MDYATKCRFSEYDKTLYREDIVHTFTRKPYNCDMIGGSKLSVCVQEIFFQSIRCAANSVYLVKYLEKISQT